MTTFRWLHLTDFHLGMSLNTDLWPNIEAAFFDDLDAVLKGTDLDLVLFTGDLVQKGDAFEYQQLEQWLQKLWEKFSELKLQPLLLAVPGNHDLVRPPEGASAAVALRDSWNEEEVQKEFRKNTDSEYRKLVERAFDNYSAWRRTTQIPKPEQFVQGLLPGDFSASIKKDQYSLAVIGLNSAFRHLGDKNTENNLSLDIRQLNAVCDGDSPKWCKQHDICLLMTHHPVSWLSKEARDHFEAEIHNPPERFAVHLFGHMHKNSLTAIGKGGGSLRRHLQGASLFGLEDFHKRTHGYSVGELIIENGTATIRFKPRKAERIPGGPWRFGRDQNNFTLDERSGATFPDQVTLLRPASSLTITSVPPLGAQSIRPSKITYDPHNSAFLVPFRAKGEFMVGRKEAIDQVREQLVCGKPTSIGQTAVFQGIGGLGKTQLAVEYAYRYRDSYPNGVYWLTADENIDAQLTGIAVKAHWIAPESEHAIKLSVARHRLKSYSDCLIIFDNLESVDAIQEYLPDPSVSPHILVTSRREQPDFADVKLDLLNEEQSFQLLVQEAGTRPMTSLDEEAAREIAIALNGLPLALELAGAYLARRFIGWLAYRDLLHANLKQALPTRLSSLTKHDADLFKTLSISENDINDEPLLSKVLDLLTWSSSSPMSVTLMEYLLNLQPTCLHGALGLGKALRLLQKTPDGDRYSIHRLVQEVRRQDCPLVQYRDWACDIAQRMGDWFESIRHDFSKLPVYEAEIEHLSAWKIQAEPFASLASTRLLWLEAYPAYQRGRYQEAFAIVQKTIKTYEEQKIDDPLLKANLLNDFANVSRKAKGDTPENTKEIITIAVQALEIRKKYLGEKHSDIATSLGNLASFHSSLDDYARALELGEQALSMRRELWGGKHFTIAFALSNLATYHSNLGNQERALELGEQALLMQRELFGEKHPDIARSLSNLAQYYCILGDKTRYFKLSEQALAMWREVLGTNHPDVAYSLDNIANHYYKLGNSKLALELGEQALVMRRELLGESHPNSVRSLIFVSKLLYANPFSAKKGKSLVENFLKKIPTDHPSRGEVHRFLYSRDGFRKAGQTTGSKKAKRRR